MSSDPTERPSFDTVVLTATRPCTIECLGQCARQALTAGEEGSGLGLPVSGAQVRCQFHTDLLQAERFRYLRGGVNVGLRSDRSHCIRQRPGARRAA